MADTYKPKTYQTEKELGAFVEDFLRRVRSQSWWLETQLVNSSVILRKRLRDLNDDDRTGAFAPPSAGGGWVSIDQSGIYSWNIVKPTIRANTSSLITARVKVTAEPVSIKNAKAEMASQVNNALIEDFEQSQWTGELQEYVANEQQLGAGVFLQTKVNPYRERRHNIKQWEQQESVTPGEALCPNCGNVTLVTEEVIAPDGLASVVCEQCGSEAMIVSMPETDTIDVETGYEEFSTGTPETKAFPFWEFYIDPIGTSGGNLDKARWFEHHYAAPLDELQLEYPDSAEEIAAASFDWGYGLRWQYALETGRRNYDDMMTDQVIDLRCVSDLYLTPSMYLNHPLSADFELKSKDGKIRFSVKKGETLDKGRFEGKPFKKAPTLCIKTVGISIIDIYPADFKKEFAYIGFLSNSSTFWSLFATELITLQDVVNYMLTIQMYHIRKNAITSIIYNAEAFDAEAFGTDLIPTKNTVVPFDTPINTTFSVVPALPLGEPMQMLQATMAVKGEISSVQPAMVGEAQPNQPYAAQLLQKQQSLGLLSPASLSTARGKVKSVKQYIRLRKELWTDEDTAEMLNRYSDWTEEHIDAFLETDIDTGLRIDFVQGSEIPQSLIEREMKLRQSMQDLMMLAQMNPAAIKPEAFTDILLEILQAGNVEIDLTNTESDLRIAEARYDRLLTMLSEQPERTDNMEWNQAVAMQIAQMPEFQPMIIEGHATIINFYAEKTRQALAKEVPDYLLSTCLYTLIQMQQQSEVALAQHQAQLQMAVQAPMMQMQQEQQMAMAQEQQAAAEAEAAQGQAANAEAMEREDNIRREEREFELERMLVNEASKEEDRKLKRDEIKSRSK